jgi:hypothetical protein
MKRQLIAVIVMIAIGLQGSLIAFAGVSPLTLAHCQSAFVSHPDASQNSCCPKGQLGMACCLDACSGAVAGAIMTMPHAVIWLGSATLILQSISTRFSSRGDSPLIRPPIL